MSATRYYDAVGTQTSSGNLRTYMWLTWSVSVSQRILNARYLTIAQILVKQSKGATPGPSEHPSRPSFEEELYLFKWALDEAPINHWSAKKLVGQRAECSRRYIYHPPALSVESRPG